MNFDRFTKKIKASAGTAITAARALNFDNMPEREDHIRRCNNRGNDTMDNGSVHSASSQSGRIRKKPLQQEKSSDTSSPSAVVAADVGTAGQQSPVGGTEVSPMSAPPFSSASPWQKRRGLPRTPELDMYDHPSSHSRSSLSVSGRSIHSLPIQQSDGRKAPPERQSTIPLLSVVQNALNRKPSSLNSDAQSSSSNGDEENEDDPIMSMIRQDGRDDCIQTTPAQQQRSKPPRSFEIETAESSKEQRQNKKTKHRFFEELEYRMSKDMDPSVTENTPPPRQHARDDDVAAANTGKGVPSSSWLWSLASGLQNVAVADGIRSAAAGPPPLSRREAPRLDSEQTGTPEDEEEFGVVSSTAVLGDDELRALTRLRHQSAHAAAIASFVGLVKRHIREAFVACTLVVGIWVFLFWRKVSEEDDVT